MSRDRYIDVVSDSTGETGERASTAQLQPCEQRARHPERRRSQEDAEHDRKAGVALSSAQYALYRLVHLRGRSQEKPTLNRPASDLHEMTCEQAA